MCLCGGGGGGGGGRGRILGGGAVGGFWGSHMVFREKQSFLTDYNEGL